MPLMTRDDERQRIAALELECWAIDPAIIINARRGGPYGPADYCVRLYLLRRLYVLFEAAR